MKSAKERKMDRKAKHKAQAVAQTAKSRQRRLDNKAKRDEIHAIDPDMKVRVIDQVTYDDDGAVIKVENGKITKWLPLAVPEVFKPEPEILLASDEGEVNVMVAPTVEVFNPEIEEVEAVEVDDVGRFQTLVKKWRL